MGDIANSNHFPSLLANIVLTNISVFLSLNYKSLTTSGQLGLMMVTSHSCESNIKGHSIFALLLIKEAVCIAIFCPLETKVPLPEC